MSLKGQAVACLGWPSSTAAMATESERGGEGDGGGWEGGGGVCVALGVKLYGREGGECEYACTHTL